MKAATSGRHNWGALGLGNVMALRHALMEVDDPRVSDVAMHGHSDAATAVAFALDEVEAFPETQIGVPLQRHADRMERQGFSEGAASLRGAFGLLS